MSGQFGLRSALNQRLALFILCCGLVTSEFNEGWRGGAGNRHLPLLSSDPG